MTGRIFPRRRDDGSFSVAIRYAILRDEAVTTARDHVEAWVRMKEGIDLPALREEFTQVPHVELLDGSTLDVVFECSSSATLWKGLMIELAGELRTINGIRRSGFWDLVTGRPHPASLEAESGDI